MRNEAIEILDEIITALACHGDFMSTHCVFCGTWYRNLESVEKGDDVPFECTNPKCPAVRARALLEKVRNA